MLFENKKIVIIGGSSGIGLAIARAAIEEGAEVLIASRSEEKLAKAKTELEGRVQTQQVNILDEDSIVNFFKEVGPFDHLQLTAAEIQFGDMDTLSISDARHSFDSKFWGPYMAVKYARETVAKEGSVTFYSGAASQRPSKDSAILTAITAAIEGLARALAIALAPIRVNVISPGITMTPLFENMGQETIAQVLAAYKEMLLVKRYATAAEVAKTAIYLMSNDYVTGSLQMINGGMNVT